MAISLADIKKLRDITGAGMMDVKKALEEAAGDFETAKDLLRKRGQAIAAKRSDREASEGCVLAKAENGFAAIVALKCETDFVAKNADFVALTKKILDLAIANKPADLEALKALKVDNLTVAELVTERSGVTGEKMELSDYAFVEGAVVDAYNHLGNKLSTIVLFSEGEAEVAHGVAMHIAAMNPMALDAEHIAEEVKARELAVAIDKTKAEEVAKAVENAIRKAGINPAHVDSDDHIESNQAKGWLTAEQAQLAREIKVSAAAEAEANLEKQAKKIEMISQGRLQKYFKENTLMDQIYVGNDDKQPVKEFLAKNKAVCVDFKRITLNQE
ncbi:MAG: translation elongation factor Ts [Paludibacteraceae bacterium]|nr:translation elongation factor Ts [Paludibacteraceae bacterium]